MVSCFCIGCFSLDKPSKEVMINIIFRIKNDKLSNITIDYRLKDIDLKPIKFNILYEFVSKHNGRYCIMVDYEIEHIPEKRIYVGSDEHYSFEKKGNQWFGWKGWGPGEW